MLAEGLTEMHGSTIPHCCIVTKSCRYDYVSSMNIRLDCRRELNQQYCVLISFSQRVVIVRNSLPRDIVQSPNVFFI